MRSLTQVQQWQEDLGRPLSRIETDQLPNIQIVDPDTQSSIVIFVTGQGKIHCNAEGSFDKNHMLQLLEFLQELLN